MLEFTPRDGGTGHRIYLTGDTLYFDGITEIARRFPTIDTALLHLGARACRAASS
jgi:L-ascorbate metabolism protein UlaG (beta-lactamase superfamily)